MSTETTSTLAPLTTATGSEARAIHQAFDETGIQFRDRVAAIAALRATGAEIAYDEAGIPHCRYDHEFLKLSDALVRLAIDDRSQADNRTLPRGANTARPNLLSRSEMTTKEKVEYVNQFGESEFLKLPSRPVTTAPVITTEDFRRLSRAEKVRRINEDPDAIYKLKQTPTAVTNGVFVNHEALAKIASIRPASRRGQ